MEHTDLNFKKLKKHLYNQELMDDIIIKLSKDIESLVNAHLLFGAELEFYFIGNIESLESTIDNLSTILTGGIKKEDGANQFEVSFIPCKDPILLIKNIILLKKTLATFAHNESSTIDFRAKPFDNLPGSALHIHLSIYQNQKNIFEGDNSKIMTHAIAGLCNTMCELMVFFINKNEDYRRITPRFNAPTNVSWGGNNRTVAIRIPCSGDNKRIEHRVASSSANPYLVVIAILIGIDHGIRNELNLREKKIYGIAYDEIYNLVKLPTSIIEAARLFKKSIIVRTYLPYLTEN